MSEAREYHTRMLFFVGNDEIGRVFTDGLTDDEWGHINGWEFHQVVVSTKGGEPSLAVKFHLPEGS